MSTSEKWVWAGIIVLVGTFVGYGVYELPIPNAFAGIIWAIGLALAIIVLVK